MTTIDFTRIRSAPKSRNDSFEALAVQMFKACYPAPSGSTFMSLRGDGGDGGVEAYFRTPAGTVTGVQAKYFFQLGSAELSQIKGSLQTALANHPSLDEYWIYVPFDLTGRVGSGRRGTSQAERFEAWKIEVETEAQRRGTKLTVVLCTAAVIRTQLLGHDPYGGVQRYWFDDSTLTTSQIQRCLDEAVAFAGPRYTAALDIVTNAHAGLDFFGGIGNFETWREDTLTPLLSELRSLKGWGDESLSILGKPIGDTAHALMSQLITSCEGIACSASATVLVADASSVLTRLLPILIAARDAQEQAFFSTHGRGHDNPAFRQFHAEQMCAFPAADMDAARKWAETALQLQEVLSSPEIGAATTASLLMVGPAGIGKTHAIVSAALRRLTAGGLSLVVFGDDFGESEPWEVLRSKLGFGASVGKDALLACLQACAEHTCLPFVIYIDALNESPRKARWKDKLPELLAQCKPYGDIRVCVSARDTYRNLVVDSRFPGFAFEHAGFTGNEFEAVQAFAAYYGLDTEITPLFSAELSNPLFLHLACKALKDEGRNSLDVSLPGFTALFESHLKHCDVQVRARLLYSNPRNLVRAAMIRLAEALTQNLRHGRTWEVCIAALQPLVGSEVAPETLLKELEHEGLVILSAEEDDTWLVRLGYQRYGDVLRATSLVETVMGSVGIDVPALSRRLAKMSADDEGLLEALAAVLPERTGVELTLHTLGLEPAQAYRLFIGALPWRSRASVTRNVEKEVLGALSTPGLWPQVYDAFFRLSLVPDHQLNAENWLGRFLRSSKLAERDAHLSIAAFKSFESNGAVRSLVNAALLADIARWPAESRRLASYALAWLTSCADRRVRDLSSKGLARLLANYPELGCGLIAEFEGCDDDYVLESIALAIYSGCLMARLRKHEFIPTFERMLSTTFDVPNILIRDTVRLLGHFLKDTGISTDVVKRLEAFPTRVRLPSNWPTLADAKPLLALANLPSNMDLSSVRHKPDFWRYQVESKISSFDLAGSGITHGDVACWLMVHTWEMGYPGKNNIALDADLLLCSEFGAGRGRRGYAERLGKKYYWISLHRLIGLLADNVAPKTDSWSDWKPNADHLWSVNVRKSDLTDARDICPARDYPDELVKGPRYDFPHHSTDIKRWVRTDDFTSHHECIVRASSNGEQWVALSLSARDEDRRSGDDSWSMPYLGVDLSYSSILVARGVPSLGRNGAIRDVFESQGASCYRGYMAEYPDSPVFEQLSAEGSFYRGAKGMLFTEVTLSRGGEWGYDYSHLSAERQEHLRVPCQDLVSVLGLSWDRQRGWTDSTGSLVAFDANAKRRSGLFIRRSALNAYLATTNKKLVFRRFANRGFFKASGSDGSQIDLFAWLLYLPENAPQVLKAERQPFNCDGEP